MKLLMYDELKLSKTILDRGFSSGSFEWSEALLVAKYFRHVENSKDAKTKTQLVNFIKERDKNFNYIRNRQTISKIVKFSKMDFVSTGDVIIYKNELDIIEEIKNFKQQKIIIAILFLSKRTTNRGYINPKDWREIKTLVSRKITNGEIQEVFSLLHSGGLCFPYGASQKIVFGEGCGNSVFKISSDADARGLIGSFIKYCGGEVGFCRRCENKYIKNHRRQVLCPSCAKESKLEKYRKYNLKREVSDSKNA